MQLCRTVPFYAMANGTVLCCRIARVRARVLATGHAATGAPQPTWRSVSRRVALRAGRALARSNRGARGVPGTARPIAGEERRRGHSLLLDVEPRAPGDRPGQHATVTAHEVGAHGLRGLGAAKRTGQEGARCGIRWS